MDSLKIKLNFLYHQMAVITFVGLQFVPDAGWHEDILNKIVNDYYQSINNCCCNVVTEVSKGSVKVYISDKITKHDMYRAIVIGLYKKYWLNCTQKQRIKMPQGSVIVNNRLKVSYSAGILNDIIFEIMCSGVKAHEIATNIGGQILFDNEPGISHDDLVVSMAALIK